MTPVSPSIPFSSNSPSPQQGGAKPKKKWSSFEHQGVLFHHPYQPHGIPVKYQDLEVTLSKEAEEMATLYAKLLGTEYLNNSRFNRNFWKDWKKVLGDTEIKDLAGCDFRPIYEHYLKKREARMALSTEEKKRRQEEKRAVIDKFRQVKVDDREEMAGNILVEPAGLFIGRGCHPKTGMFRKSIQPEEVTLNLSKGHPIPKIYYLSSEHTLVEMEGRRWGKIIHDQKLEWVASWRDHVTGKRKYVWLDHTSEFKSASDVKKFELARKLKKKIFHIREQMTELFFSGEKKDAQLATALFLIDKLALRVGNEKGEDTADTVGVTSLRVEHINFEGGKDTIVLDFLGKDSMRYYNKIQVPAKVYQNLAAFTRDKKPDDPLFELINSGDLNEYLQTLMKDLTAKTFRTFNASHTFQHKINKIYKKYPELPIPEAPKTPTGDTAMSETPTEELETPSETELESVPVSSASPATPWTKEQLRDILEMFERANIEVAKLCNHQKKAVSSLKTQLENIRNRIEELRKKKRRAQSKKRTKTVAKRITKINTQIKALRAKISLKNELKNISLSTSKVNYIDPRITFAFSRKMQIPIEKLYSQTLVKKFHWAHETPANFKF